MGVTVGRKDPGGFAKAWAVRLRKLVYQLHVCVHAKAMHVLRHGKELTD